MIIYTSSMHIWDWVLYLPYLWIDLFFYFSLYTAREMRALCNQKDLAGWTYHLLSEWFGIIYLIFLLLKMRIIIYILQCLWEKRGWMDIYYFSNMANPSYMLRKIRFFPLSLISSMITSFIVLFHFDKLHASCSQTDKPSRN